MSEPEIWIIKMADHPQDDFVRYSAYKALDLQRAEVIVENARLKAEVERLRKAVANADGELKLLAEWAVVCEVESAQINKVRETLNAAKEGKQP